MRSGRTIPLVQLRLAAMLSVERLEGLPIRTVALLGQVWDRIKLMRAVERSYFGVEMAEKASLANEVPR